MSSLSWRLSGLKPWYAIFAYLCLSIFSTCLVAQSGVSTTLTVPLNTSRTGLHDAQARGKRANNIAEAHIASVLVDRQPPHHVPPVELPVVQQLHHHHASGECMCHD